MAPTRRAGSLIAGLVAALLLAACSGDVATGTDGNAIYNASYVGPGTIARSPVGYAGATPQPTQVTLTLSQLGSTFTGSMSNALTSSLFSYTGDVSGRVTSTGGSFIYVQSPCAGTLYGTFTAVNGVLSGSAVGRDCDAGGTGDNVRITFTNLVRQ